ncbi:MAG: hypothetical protein CMF99_00765 [Candidatus Marinimicrobia bacterium]|nr:hypothetical protein [Candidatus Neomarinimicrobiota bacterium]
MSYSSDNDEMMICDRCHSHNDYLNDVPILNALKYGYKSIEVDIVLDNNQLYVAHYWWTKKKDVFINNTYLDTLYKIFINNEGSIYKNNNPLILLVDIKSSPNETYEVFNRLLNNYKPMLSYVINDSFVQGAVTIILSGKRPVIEHLKKSTKRYVFIDGRTSDLGKSISKNVMPIISINWKKEFNWRGYQEFPVKEEEHLLELIKKVHSERKMIRFWGSPDNIKSWELLYLNDVDLINTDKVAELYNYIITNK